MVMETDRALALRLLSNYPGWPIGEMNVLSIAETLGQIGGTAEEIVEIARQEFTRPPSGAQLLELAAQRISQLPTVQRLELPDVEAVPMPHEVRVKVREMVTREVVVDEAEAQWKRQVATAAREMRPLRTCTGFGKAPVEQEGKFVCPDCGVEIS